MFYRNERTRDTLFGNKRVVRKASNHKQSKQDVICTWPALFSWLIIAHGFAQVESLAQDACYLHALRSNLRGDFLGPPVLRG